MSNFIHLQHSSWYSRAKIAYQVKHLYLKQNLIRLKSKINVYTCSFTLIGNGIETMK